MTTPNKKDKEALGKGIRSLLQNIDPDLKTPAGGLSPAVAENATGILRIPLDLIETNPKQPRKDFDETALQELAASIRMHDIIQPVTVPNLPPGNTGSFPENAASAQANWQASKIFRHISVRPMTSNCWNSRCWKICSGKTSMPWKLPSAISA